MNIGETTNELQAQINALIDNHDAWSDEDREECILGVQRLAASLAGQLCGAASSLETVAFNIEAGAAKHACAGADCARCFPNGRGNDLRELASQFVPLPCASTTTDTETKGESTCASESARTQATTPSAAGSSPRTSPGSSSSATTDGTTTSDSEAPPAPSSARTSAEPRRVVAARLGGVAALPVDGRVPKPRLRRVLSAERSTVHGRSDVLAVHTDEHVLAAAVRQRDAATARALDIEAENERLRQALATYVRHDDGVYGVGHTERSVAARLAMGWPTDEGTEPIDHIESGAVDASASESEPTGEKR